MSKQGIKIDMSSYQSVSFTSFNDFSHDRLKSISESDRDTNYGIVTKLSDFKASAILLIGIGIGIVAGFFFSDSTFSFGRNINLQGFDSSTWIESKNFIDTLPSDFRSDKEEKYIEEPYNNLSLTSFPPNDLVYFDNNTAIEMLLEPSTLNTHYFLYETGLEAQINQAYCAVASMSAILNSLRFHYDFDMPVDRVYSPYPYSTQHDIFFSCTNENVILETGRYDGVLTPPYGLTLDQASLLLECHVNRDIHGGNWSVAIRHVDPNEWTVDLMRDEMIEILKNKDSRVAINYHRASLGQVGGGHFSPIGGKVLQVFTFGVFFF